MPLPKNGEPFKVYMPRCMSSKEMIAKFPDSGQRAAVCYSYWNNRHKKKKGEDNKE